ncbi:type II toxin-antitoxin system PemK/MazF family toxin [Citricoccus muralis]|uniref:Type II toxin-antitoxin system PemK/MazF family toxin n=1 Tax=Citricoccus muralis TaxID=169134 RepID=A0ABY8H2N9_9MICC|nr:type II toxin-antitoxin system PemK/MazF family toxin [Citricoccus muralis]WFP15399.1 type II toxin-antitoxin system PemK/MazF family toxin [Citricoccus muralis]
MAMNLHRIMRLGRQVTRLAQQINRARQGNDTPQKQRQGGNRSAENGAGTRTPPQTSHEVTDYTGDFRGAVRCEYDPVPGPQAGPGEVVWTWVPFEELDGRGKDRPVLIIARRGRYLLALQLTTRDRNNASSPDEDYLDIGSGAWDPKGRPSEVNLTRVLQLNPRDLRREGGVLEERIYQRVAAAVEARTA